MLLWLVLLACLSCSATAGQLRDVWEFNLGGAYPGAQLEVFGLSFSPDGRRVAALVGHSWEQEFVLLLDTADPRSGQKRLEINPKTSMVGPYARDGFSWSASGKQFVVGGIRVRVEDGATCSFPDSVGTLHFTGEDTLVGGSIRSVPPPGGRGFRIGRPVTDFFDSDCRSAGATSLTRPFL
jgi:hypothetical protein